METRGNHIQQELDPEEELDPEDPDEGAGRARVEREHMLELYSGDYPELKLAFEDWERTSRLLKGRVKHGMAVGRLAMREICHLAGVFVVVEGVLLTTLSQAQILTCGSWWISFHLSFLASVMVLIPLVQRVSKYWCARVRIRSLLSALEVGNFKPLFPTVLSRQACPSIQKPLVPSFNILSFMQPNLDRVEIFLS